MARWTDTSRWSVLDVRGTDARGAGLRLVGDKPRAGALLHEAGTANGEGGDAVRTKLRVAGVGEGVARAISI